MTSSVIIDPSEFQGPLKEIEDFICGICRVTVAVVAVGCTSCEKVFCKVCTFNKPSCPGNSCDNLNMETSRLPLVVRQSLENFRFSCNFCEEGFDYKARCQHRCQGSQEVDQIVQLKKRLFGFEQEVSKNYLNEDLKLVEVQNLLNQAKISPIQADFKALLNDSSKTLSLQCRNLIVDCLRETEASYFKKQLIEAKRSNIVEIRLKMKNRQVDLEKQK